MAEAKAAGVAKKTGARIKTARSSLDFLKTLKNADKSDGMEGRQSVLIDIDLIEPDPNQPRSTFRPLDGRVQNEVQLSLRELADDIAQNKLLQPITVRALDDGRYMINWGERRWRAYHLNRDLGREGYDRIECFIEADEEDVTLKIVQLSENLQRQDLTDLEIATYLKSLLDNYEELKQRDLAKLLNKSEQWISRILGLLDPKYELLVKQGFITYAAVLEQFKTLSEKHQEELAADAAASRSKITTPQIRAKKSMAASPMVQNVPIDQSLENKLKQDLSAEQVPGEQYQHEPRVEDSYTDRGISSPDIHTSDDVEKAVVSAGMEQQDIKLRMSQVMVLGDHLSKVADCQVSVKLSLAQIRSLLSEMGVEPSDNDLALAVQLIETINKNIQNT